MKELSIEEKAQAYDEVLKKARMFYKDEHVDNEVNSLIEVLFPELKESEDERIRNALIEYCQVNMGHTWHNIKQEDYIAFLEKLGKEPNPYSGVSFNYNDHTWGMCARDNGVDILLDSHLLKHLDRHIVPKADLPKWKYKKDNTPLLRDSIILNKYGCVAKSPSGALVSDVWVLDYAELAKLPKEECDKQDEQNLAEGEPRFHEGDWIIFNGLTLYVKEVVKGFYRTISVGGTPNSYDWDIDNAARLWNIREARNGDVLSLDLMGGKTFVYDGINPDMAILYSFIINNDGKDVLPYHIGKPNTGIGNIEEVENIIHPASKEQREALMKAVTEAGWGFDFDKRELKKVEHKPDAVEPRFHEGEVIRPKDGGHEPWQIVQVDIEDKKYRFKDGYVVLFSQQDDYELIEQSSFWSEEDEKEVAVLEAYIRSKDWSERHIDRALGIVDELVNKVKSINSQSRRKWSEEDENTLNSIITNYESGYLPSFDKRDEIVKKLKSLKDRYTWKPSDEHYELEEFAKIVRSNLTGISKAVQELFEAKYLQLTGNKMYGGFKD